MQTARGGFTPYVRTERSSAANRRTAASTARPLEDALAVRKCGRTVLAVVTAAPILRKTLGGYSDKAAPSYAVVALGNAGRETRTLAAFDTLDRAEQYLSSYSPKWGLLK